MLAINWVQYTLLSLLPVLLFLQAGLKHFFNVMGSMAVPPYLLRLLNTLPGAGFLGIVDFQ